MCGDHRLSIVLYADDGVLPEKEEDLHTYMYDKLWPQLASTMEAKDKLLKINFFVHFRNPMGRRKLLCV